MTVPKPYSFEYGRIAIVLDAHFRSVAKCSIMKEAVQGLRDMETTLILEGGIQYHACSFAVDDENVGIVGRGTIQLGA